jgi:hypothetical protein
MNSSVQARSRRHGRSSLPWSGWALNKCREPQCRSVEDDPSPGVVGTRRTPSGWPVVARGGQKSRPGGPPGRVARSTNGPPRPFATWRLASNRAVGPRVWCVASGRARGEPAPLAASILAASDARPMDVRPVGPRRRPPALAKVWRPLPPCDADPGPGRPERGEAGQVCAVQRLLEPQDVVLGELDGDLARRNRIERGRCVAGHPPALVEVDHDRHRIGDRVTCRRDRREALLEPARIDPDLERRDPSSRRRSARTGASRQAEQHPTCVRGDPPPNRVATSTPATWCGIHGAFGAIPTRMEIDGPGPDLVGDVGGRCR